MTVDNSIAVLGWCMVINFGLMLFWVLAIWLMPNVVYRSQALFTSMSREDLDRTMYRLIGQFKFAVIIFNLAPYLALRIVFN